MIDEDYTIMKIKIKGNEECLDLSKNNEDNKIEKLKTELQNESKNYNV